MMAIAASLIAGILPADKSALSVLLPAYQQKLTARVGPTLKSYIPHTPHPQQKVFLDLDCKEALYGGAAGGGKSDALLMAALQYVHTPGYSAIIFRKTFRDLSLPDALIPRSHEWLAGTDAKWDGLNYAWHFPSGAVLAFGYMDSGADKYRYQGSAYQYIGWDELTQFEEEYYRYMFSRLRTTTGVNVPLRVRGASNPGGVGHRWVKHRFINPRTKTAGAEFVPAKVKDNPSLRGDYSESLMYLDDVTRARYLDGDWTVVEDNRFVYAEFDADKHMRESPWTERKDYKDVIVGVDPGTRDAYAAVVLGLDWDGVWWALDEVYEHGLSTNRLMPKFKSLQERHEPSKWFVDRNKPTDIMDLIDGGLKAKANLVLHGENERATIRPMIGVVADVLHAGRLFFSSKCDRLMSEMEGYVYREAEDRNAGEVPVDKDNHAVDALRYGICSVEELAFDRRQRRRSGADMKPRPQGQMARDPRKGVVIPSMQETLLAMDRRMDEAERRGRGRR